ncbi:MAG: hypothetical protein Ct9H300mP9_2440 [Candidatus Neomarinimicrobiota bacterium]|nr:MAG: hypothetical protein Ct9H300mP9_2440 [Candidatus Neomarinimicrobiota bacterium]
MAEKVYNKNKIETSIIGRIFVDFSAYLFTAIVRKIL